MIKEVDDIECMFARDTRRNIFKNYIEYIRFPYYKNFSKNLKINFTFPITFLVGANGTGKSSLLHALYGSPKGKSVGDFWFTTDLDPIKDMQNNRHCFIYGYITHKTKTQIEVLKSRINRPDNPDYWEPARPNISYGMEKFLGGYDLEEASKTRWNAIEKKTHYLDFRYELSAYDKYFYFGLKPNSHTMKSKQDLIRKFSKRLKMSYKYNIETTYYNQKSYKPTSLTEKELKIISNILGKNYTKALILKHNFYDKSNGFSILYETDYKEYSEAFAGSGETAVVKLVHDLNKVEDHSLILLDEPETSLHPGAQKKLINYLLSVIKEKKIQVVVSTHSPDIIENMPKESIKVFYTNPKTNVTDIIEGVLPQEAFLHLGHSITNKKTIIVEDILAKKILEKTLEKIGGIELFEIKYFPGGESRLKQEFMNVYSKEESKKHFIIFDGDQRKDSIDVSKLSEADKILATLNQKIIEIVGEPIKFNVDGSDGNGREDQKIDLMIKYIKYHRENIFYLPKEIPEEIIWNEDVLDKTDIEEDKKEIIKSEDNMKNKFNLFALYMFDNDSSTGQNSAYDYFLLRWIKNENTDFEFIKNMLNEIKGKE